MFFWVWESFIVMFRFSAMGPRMVSWFPLMRMSSAFSARRSMSLRVWRHSSSEMRPNSCLMSPMRIIFLGVIVWSVFCISWKMSSVWTRGMRIPFVLSSSS